MAPFFKGLISSNHSRIIKNFNESLNGFYWCQIEVNNTCLQPSPYGRVIFNSSSENSCNITLHRDMIAVCAVSNLSMSCQSTVTGSGTITTTLPSTESRLPTTTMTLIPTSLLSMEPPTLMALPTSTMPFSDRRSSSMVPYNLCIVIGAPVGAVVVLVILLVVIICLIRRKRKQMDHVSHSVITEYKIQSSE